MRWDLDDKIISKASSKELLLKYLEPVYTRIVQPMERQIRSLMFLFRQHTEAALFASDLKFHISCATTEDIQSSLKFAKGDPFSGAKPDEALTILNMKLTTMTRTFKGLLKSLIEELGSDSSDFTLETNVSVALYMASYFHVKNLSCRAFVESCGENPNLLAFMKAWQADEHTRLAKVKPKAITRLMKSQFTTYLEETRAIEESAMTNPKRLQEAIELKKLFAVPWLLASDILFTKHDFLVRAYGHTEVKKQQEKAKKPTVV